MRQPYWRVVEALDLLKGENKITDDVFIQSGYSTYKPVHCPFSDFLGFDEMIKQMANADIVITHGGTGSIMLVLYHNKIPVVIPRQKKYNEHIDDHQVHFCKTMEDRGKIIAAYETEDLEGILLNYDERVAGLRKNGPESQNRAMTQQADLISDKLTALCAKWNI